MTREEYIGKKVDKLEILRKEKEKNPAASVRKLSEITGLTKSTIARLGKLL
ncbi:hypothetical protein [Bacillus thuringiensis]|uniref:hypothetical protein n=1 Tax=Bacillus thuringiensis TaxID=1428 RepID=UPI003B97E028